MKKKKNLRGKYQYGLISALIIVVLDQITKYFQINPIKNTGAGFGILQDQTTLLIWFSIIVIGVIFFIYDKLPENKFVLVTVGFILGGTIGNLIDRIILGYVVDFIDLGFWPAFNIADSALTIGVIGLIIYYWKK